MAKPKKKWRDTTFAKILGAAAGLVNPELGKLVGGVSNIGEAIEGIVRDGSLSADQRENLKNLAHELEIQQFEAEVQDRASARDREAAVALSGGDDTMFKIVGGSILLIFAILIGLLFFSNVDLGENQALVQIVFGAVLGYVANIVAYYYGSSLGSKQKTSHLMNNKNDKTL